MNEHLNLVFTIDSNYIQHFTVALTSILENNKKLSINVFLIHDLKTIHSLDKVVIFFKEKYNIVLKLCQLNSEIFDRFHLTHHVSKATYFRLLLADILPSEIDSCLFVDSDIVVTGSLQYILGVNFFEHPPSGSKFNFLYAVNEFSEDNIKRLNNLGFAAKKYFNAGIMYINIKAWREEKVAEKLMKIASDYKQHLLWWDQDVLNMFFYNLWSEMPSTYNAFALAKIMDKTPVIVHYTGTFKPWDYGNKHPYRKLYFHYQKLTPFKYYSPLFLLIKRKFKKAIKILKAQF